MSSIAIRAVRNVASAACLVDNIRAALNGKCRQLAALILQIADIIPASAGGELLMLVRVLAAALTGAIAALVGTLVATRGDVDQLAITLAIAFAIVGGAAEWWRQARKLSGRSTSS